MTRRVDGSAGGDDSGVMGGTATPILDPGDAQLFGIAAKDAMITHLTGG